MGFMKASMLSAVGCSMLFAGAVASDQEIGVGRRLLRTGPLRGLSGASEEDAVACGSANMPICSGAQMAGRLFECDFGYVGMGGICVPYREKQNAPVHVPAPRPPVHIPLHVPAPPPPAPAPPPPAPPPPPPPAPAAGGSDDLINNVGVETPRFGGPLCEDQLVKDLISKDNAYRAQFGFAPLACDEQICQMALEHSRSQCQRRSMDHDLLMTTDGAGNRGERMRAMKLFSRGENAFWNEHPFSMQAEKAHAGLMASCYHQSNLMDPAFTKVGYGWHVCPNGPTRREQADGSFTAYPQPLDSPVMYHTATFGGGQRTAQTVRPDRPPMECS